MANEKRTSLLEALERVCNVDVDAIDPKDSTKMPFQPHNQTSNQVICCNTMLQPEYRDIFLENVKKYGSQGWEEVFNRVSVQFCADNRKNITGRVLVQVSPSHVHDKQQVLDQCHAYDRAFRDHGITRDQYAIKIASTGPGLAAAKILTEEGIRTLGTSMFSLPQAIAASQAGCLFVSPYLNEVAAYEDDSLMHKGDDPAMTHPMAPRLVHILETYAKMYQATGKDQPLIVIASNANIGEIIATAELGCQHITILAHHLEELQNTTFDDTARSRYPFLKDPPPKRQAPYYKDFKTRDRLQGHMKIDPLIGPTWDGNFASNETDWLANDGEALSKAIEADSAVVKKLKDVFKAFGDADVKAKAAIESEIANLKG
ncbi:Transaldolase [Colletotrichum sp. SAR 10_99]|nr:Transaldolase [Colletotrichum sp. SAR 10_96]KAJ5012079.1 Transaldolase [Colletotrichum sp. SAR 10_99]